MLDGRTALVSDICKDAKIVCFATMASEDDGAARRIRNLNELHKKYYPELVVIGTPTSDFYKAEKGTIDEVR